MVLILWSCAEGGGRDRVSSLQQLGVREGKMRADGLRRHHRLQAAV